MASTGRSAVDGAMKSHIVPRTLTDWFMDGERLFSPH